jgi:hypothetical protein
VSKGEVNELFLGAFGALFFGAATNAPIILTITGEGGAALAVPLVLPPVAAACLAFMAGFVAAVGAAGLIVHLFKKLGVNESYAPVTTGLALQSANDQSEVGVPSTLGFLANHDTDGFTGHYTATIRWHLR